MDKFNRLMVLAIVFLMASVTWEGYWAVNAIPASGTNSICEPGGCGSGFPCTFSFYIDGSNYNAAKCIGGGNPYISSTLSTVFASVMADPACTSGCGLHFGQGIWTVTSALAITHSFVTIQGIDWSSTEFKAGNSLNGDVIDTNTGVCTPCYYLTFRDFSVDGNSANQASGIGINLQGMNRPNIDHVRVHNAKGDGVSGSCGTFTCNSPYIENSLFDANGNRGLFLQSVFGAYVIHTAMDANLGAGILLASGGESFFTTIELDGTNPWGTIMDTESRDQFNGIWCGTNSNYCVRLDNTVNDPYFNDVMVSAGTPGAVQFDASVVCNRCVFHDVTNTGGAGTTGFNFVAGSKFFNSTISDSDMAQATTKTNGQIPVNMTLENDRGINPVGLVTNFIISPYIGYCGTGTSIVSTTEYTICDTAIILTCTGGTVTNITVEDSKDNTIFSVANCAALPATGVYLPIGFSVSWTETVSPTINVYGE